MNAEIVNLRRVRKARARTERDAEAAAARISHGRTTGERRIEAIEADRARRVVDGARREPAPDTTRGE